MKRFLAPEVDREELKDGSVRLRAAKASFMFYRLRPGLVLVCAEGHDRGELGWAPMDELSQDLSRFAPIELFIDGVGVDGVTAAASDKWTQWLSENRASIKSCNILVRSKFMHITIEVAKLFSRTGEMIRVYLDEGAFEEAIARAAPGFTRLPPRED
jgi:hypothetical protein